MAPDDSADDDKDCGRAEGGREEPVPMATEMILQLQSMTRQLASTRPLDAEAALAKPPPQPDATDLGQGLELELEPEHEEANS